MLLMASCGQFTYFQAILSIFLLILEISDCNDADPSCRCLDNYDSTASYHDVSCYGINTTAEVSCVAEFLVNISATDSNFQMTINLYSSNLQVFPNDFLEPYSVIGILLDDCTMSNIPKLFISEVCFTLTTLHIRNSDIKKIRPSAFPDCLMLSSLLVHSSSIKTVAAKAFQNLFNLQELDLHMNQINKFNGFSGIESLKMLNLAHNRIKNINKNSFQNTPMLTTIFLNNNHLETLETDAFGSLSELQYLDLNHNRLHSFSGFSGIGSLRMLNLSSNHIHNIDREAFKKLDNLWLLYLDHNNLSTLPEGIFSPLESNPDTALVSLEGNPLHCNCSLQWLQRWFTEHPKIQGSNSTTCSSPIFSPLMTLDLCDLPTPLDAGKSLNDTVTSIMVTTTQYAVPWISTAPPKNSTDVQKLLPSLSSPSPKNSYAKPSSSLFGSSTRTQFNLATLIGFSIAMVFSSFMST